MVRTSTIRPGDLVYAVIGNRGRLLDAPRTPLSITDVIAERGELEVRWRRSGTEARCGRLLLWEIAHVQFASDNAQASGDLAVRLKRAVEQFGRDLIIEANGDVLPRTRRRVAEGRQVARGLLGHLAGMIELEACVQRPEADERLYTALNRFLAERDLVSLDRRFTEAMVSNPRSRELVKGHATVLAELGLCRFHGTVIRDPALFCR